MSLAQLHLPSVRSVPRKRVAVASGEILLTSALLLLYFFARGGAAPDAVQVDGSVSRAIQIVHFERKVGIFQEPAVQSLFIQHDAVMAIANWIYAWGHFPVLLAIGVWLAFKDVERFRFLRNVMLLSGVIGIVCYYLLPTTPPRLLEAHGFDFGFTDTVHSATSNSGYFKPGPLANDYAAIPSFHFGWIALASAALWVNTSNRWVRVGAVFMSIAMGWAIVVTANHYFFDMIMGAVVIGLAWVIVAGLQREPLGLRANQLRERLKGRRLQHS